MIEYRVEAPDTRTLLLELRSKVHSLEVEVKPGHREIWNRAPSLKIWAIGIVTYSTLNSEILAAYLVALLSN